MANEPPSLAARLEHDGPLSWREAARLAARIARALDRLHAQGKAHGGLEPLTVLFVGGTVRLADPLPAATRDAAFLAPSIRAGEPPDRQSDFYALGQLMAALRAGDPHAQVDDPGLPPPLAAVQRRLVDASAAAGYRSGNDVAAALELAIAASEGFAAGTPTVTPPPLAPPPPATERVAAAAPASSPTAKRPGARPRRRRPVQVVGLLACLALGGLAVLWLWPDEEMAVVAPPALDVALPEPPEQLRAPDGVAGAAPPATAEATSPIPMEDVLAALPELPLGPPPAKPETRAQVQALLAELATWPCSRLEVEPTPLGLRLVGSTSTATARTTLLGAIADLDDVDRVSVELNSAGAHCRLYDLLAARAEVAMPRLADLYPARADYRLAAAEPLVVRVLTPDFSSYVMVDYFTADGMVVHLVKHEAALDPLQPRTELRIGDPADGHWLAIAEPFGQELVLVIAGRAPLFAEPRPQIEPADAYLDALEAALTTQAEPPLASTMAIETIPAGP